MNRGIGLVAAGMLHDIVCMFRQTPIAKLRFLHLIQCELSYSLLSTSTISHL